MGRNASAHIAGRARRPVAQTHMQCGVHATLSDAYVARWHFRPSLRSAPAARPLRRQGRVRADALPAAHDSFQLGRQHRLQRGKRHDTAGAHDSCWRRSRWRRPKGSQRNRRRQSCKAPLRLRAQTPLRRTPRLFWPGHPGSRPGPGRCGSSPSRPPLSPSPLHGLSAAADFVLAGL